MITNILGTLELILLLLVITFALRILALAAVLTLTIFHPERRAFYMEVFRIKKSDL